MKYLMLPIQFIGFLFFMMLVCICRFLPHRTANRMMGGLAYTIGRCINKHRVVLRNLEMVFPNWEAEKYHAVARDTWYNIGYIIVDMMRGNTFNFDEDVTFQNDYYIRDAIHNGGGFLVVSAHLGSWEMVLPFLKHLGVKQHAIYRFLKNPFMDAWIRKNRGQYVHALLEKTDKTTGIDMMRALKAGDAVSILSDQKMNNGIEVEFLGRPSMTASGVGSFVAKGITAIPMQIIRNQDTTSFTVVFYPALDNPNTGDKASDVHSIMQSVYRHYDNWIYENPSQYLWLHRRWDKGNYR